MGQRRLRVEVDTEHAVAVKGGGMGEVLCDDGLPDAAFEVRHGHAHGTAPGAFRQQLATAELGAAAQLVDLFEAEPALAAILFGEPLGQGRVVRQLLAQGVGGDVEHELADLPDGEGAQGLDLSGGEGGAAHGGLLFQAALVHVKKVVVISHLSTRVFKPRISNNANSAIWQNLIFPKFAR